MKRKPLDQDEWEVLFTLMERAVFWSKDAPKVRAEILLQADALDAVSVIADFAGFITNERYGAK